MKTSKQEDFFDCSFAVSLQPEARDVLRVFSPGPGEEFLVPVPLDSPLEPAEYARYVGQRVPVTFVLGVPLATLMSGDIEAFVQDMVFCEPVRLFDFEYRAVGASFDTFDGNRCGRVHVQVVCGIDPVG